jgi:hypothetical protein
MRMAGAAAVTGTPPNGGEGTPCHHRLLPTGIDDLVHLVDAVLAEIRSTQRRLRDLRRRVGCAPVRRATPWVRRG